jgi:prepilin-type N-terminal cleavage/methylation domain-containing protein
MKHHFKTVAHADMARFRRTQRTVRGAGGFTLLELLLALVVFAGVAVGMMVCFSRAAISDTMSGENMKARAAASKVMDSVRDYAADHFDKTYAYYNSVASDDPDGYGTAPGNTITLTGTDSPAGSATVRIEFPDSNGQLYENITDTNWAMPRDLNGDDSVGAAAINSTYKLLPVRVVVTWQGTRGTVTYKLVSVITEKRVQR